MFASEIGHGSDAACILSRMSSRGRRAMLTCDAIADACHVLRSAIADVRNIIHQADGLMDLPEAVPALD